MARADKPTLYRDSSFGWLWLPPRSGRRLTSREVSALTDFAIWLDEHL